MLNKKRLIGKAHSSSYSLDTPSDDVETEADADADVDTVADYKNVETDLDHAGSMGTVDAAVYAD